jgi:hypothetical protein
MSLSVMDLTPYLQLGGTGFLGFLMYKVVMRMLQVIGSLRYAIDKNTKAIEELYTYVRTRNGTLERLAMADPRVKRAVKAIVKEKRTKK